MAAFGPSSKVFWLSSSTKMFSFSFPRCLKRLNDELDLLKGERGVTVRYDDEIEIFVNVFDFVKEQVDQVETKWINWK